ncbi:hypothetical protein HDU79_004434 [Rhizoclosmatium sp. JEL0117]|nr:hypothetical protein HDU79_004434 [Rhizoclosmatium sp. JEL0117]
MSQPTAPKGRVVLVLGGARSGKSTFAEKLAVSTGEKLLYIATAKRIDAEMVYRIDKHIDDRKDIDWTTKEVPVHLSTVDAGDSKVILVDCVTVWLANWMGHLGYPKGEEVDEEAVQYADKLDKTAREEMSRFLEKMVAEGRTVVLVANEVGLGIVPMYKTSRYYRDTLGRINQDIGRIAERVYWMVAGFGVDIKKLSEEATLKI